MKHLQILDEIFANTSHPYRDLYLELRRDIETANKEGGFVTFDEELYVGGKKGSGETGYGRQMILSDIFQYIINGRGYYSAERSMAHRKAYLKIILYLVNQLMIWDSLTVNPNLRGVVLDKLEEEIGHSFFKEKQMEEEHQKLREYNGNIGFETAIETLPKDEKTRLDEYYDSLLPKTAGGLWNELLVYAYLLRIDAGYVLPLLLNQRILSRMDVLPPPPDYLLITHEGDLFGIEVGGRKELQSGAFQQRVRGIRAATTENPFIPRRCPICGNWELFCDKVINDFVDIDENPLLYVKKDIRCAHDCEDYSFEDVIDGKCPFIQYQGPTDENRSTKQKIKFATHYHYHYSCILQSKDQTALATIEKQVKRFEKHRRKYDESPKECIHDRMKIRSLKANYPYVMGLDDFERPSRGRMICYGKFRDDRNCELCPYTDDCKRLTEINRIMQMSKLEGARATADKIANLFSD